LLALTRLKYLQFGNLIDRLPPYLTQQSLDAGKALEDSRNLFNFLRFMAVLYKQTNKTHAGRNQQDQQIPETVSSVEFSAHCAQA
jgi:hypothetical protein